MSAPVSLTGTSSSKNGVTQPPPPMDRSPNAVADAGSVRKDVIAEAPKDKNYKGFVAGVFSGVTKLSVG